MDTILYLVFAAFMGAAFGAILEGLVEHLLKSREKKVDLLKKEYLLITELFLILRNLKEEKSNTITIDEKTINRILELTLKNYDYPSMEHFSKIDNILFNLKTNKTDKVYQDLLHLQMKLKNRLKKKRILN